MSSTAPQRRTSLPRSARAAVDRARLTVVPRLRTRAPRVPFVMLVSLILLAGIVGLLLFNTSMQQASFTATRLEDQARTLSSRQEALAMELDQLRDPENLADQACAIGMVVGPTPAFLDVDTFEVTGTPASAVAGPCGLEPVVRPAPPVPEDTLVRPGRRTDQRSGAAQQRTREAGR